MSTLADFNRGDEVVLTLHAIVRSKATKNATWVYSRDLGTVAVSDTVEAVAPPAPPLPTSLGSLIRSKISGTYYVRVRGGWIGLESHTFYKDGVTDFLPRDYEVVHTQ